MDTHVVDVIKLIVLGTVLAGIFVVLPVMTLLLEHQRKMARILNGRPDEELREDVRQLRADLREALGAGLGHLGCLPPPIQTMTRIASGSASM